MRRDIVDRTDALTRDKIMGGRNFQALPSERLVTFLLAIDHVEDRSFVERVLETGKISRH